MMEWILTIICAVMSVVLLSGHGAFLIAGYNTSSKADKAKYDEKKLCRVMGTGFSVITVLLTALSILGGNAPSWFGKFFGAAVLLDVIVLLYVSNTKCYAKDAPKATEEDPKAVAAREAGNRKVMIGSMIFTGIVFVFVGIILFTGNIHIKYGENEFTVEASYWPDRTIPYEEIEKLELVRGVKAGSRTNGFGSFRLSMGHFKNEEYGSYIRYTYADCEETVVMDVKGTTVVLAGKDLESTEEIYRILKEKTLAQS